MSAPKATISPSHHLTLLSGPKCLFINVDNGLAMGLVAEYVIGNQVALKMASKSNRSFHTT